MNMNKVYVGFQCYQILCKWMVCWFSFLDIGMAKSFLKSFIFMNF